MLAPFFYPVPIPSLKFCGMEFTISLIGRTLPRIKVSFITTTACYVSATRRADTNAS